jgi:hypothetical protein
MGPIKRIWKPPKKNDWRDISTHKKFFDDFALQKKFDPLQPANWYQFSSKDFSKKVRVNPHNNNK